MAQRILVAENNRILRSLISESLEAAGYEFVTTEDGQQAIEILKKQQFDLLLTDKSMPHVGGITLLKEAEQLYPSMKRVLMSSEVIKLDKLPRYHADEFINKSEHEFLDKLLALIEETLHP